ncbi:hypothetical protein TNCV_2045552 [Trichonephila clavipes]|uniref:Uncharacterized protein n=1 Tax=Trichonephila clavipes TaxID=2585209 RepID=A0A8X6SZ64_TRICX|nr:hypothetical protein TNCV_2045552 [Trichonephila clavipes]
MLLEWQKVSLQDCGSDAKKRGNVQCCLCGNTANNDQYNLLSAMSSLNSQYDVNSKTVSFGNRGATILPKLGGMALRSSPTYKLSFSLASEFASARAPKCPVCFRAEKENLKLDFRCSGNFLSNNAGRP